MNSSNDRAIVVDPRFCGPPRSANGGYLAGRLAAFVDGADAVVEVTLRSPPPLGVRLEVSDAENGELALRSPQTLVAQAKLCGIPADAPAPVAFDEAVEAAERYAGRRHHPFPTCFVCGLDRARGDGLRLQPGSVAPSRVAAAWQPHESLRASSGVAAEFVWSALDCPGGWATDIDSRPMVLGRMSARLVRPPEIGEPCVVVGQLEGTDGRKAFTTSALYSADAELLAHAQATWLAIDPAAVRPVGV